MVTLDSGPGKLIGSFYFIATIDQLGVQVSASVNGFNVTDDNTYSECNLILFELPSE